MSDWNSQLYMQFEKPRTQPVIDLINSLNISTVNRGLDLGCGPGNSTEQLHYKWSQAEIIGIDSSESMLTQARERLPDTDFRLVDATDDLSTLGSFDIILSNAVIQWIKEQKRLINRLFNMLNKDGVLAMQIPNVSKMAINYAVNSVVTSDKWSSLKNADTGLHMHHIEYYYELCSKLSSSLFIWSTDYYHIMNSHTDILNWYKSTGLKPYLETLPPELHPEFESDILSEIVSHYPEQPDGKILFPFTRQFITLYK